MKKKLAIALCLAAIATPACTPAQAGVSRERCEVDGQGVIVSIDRGRRTIIIFDEKDRRWTFPVDQRYLRTPSIWHNSKGYKTLPDGTSYTTTLNGKPCEQVGYERSEHRHLTRTGAFLTDVAFYRLPQSSSASRFTAGASGFLNLSQSGVRPDGSAAQPLRHDALQPHLAGVAEDDVARVGQDSD